MAGFRKPSVKKSFTARTTGRYKRAVKRATNPLYGKKGAGFVKDPERSVKNAVYHRTTVGGLSGINQARSKSSEPDTSYEHSGHPFAGIAVGVAIWLICFATMGWFFGSLVGGFVGFIVGLAVWTH